MKSLRLIPFLVFLVSMFSAGCGGGGSSAPKTVVPSITVDWPARTRGVLTGPSSALSVAIVLHSNSALQADIEIDGSRSAALSADTETYVAPSAAAMSGTYTMTATFYSQPSQVGRVTATALATGSLSAAGLLVDSSGIPLSTIAFSTKVNSIVIASAQTVAVGTSAQIVATALDAASSIIPLTPGAFTFSVPLGNPSGTITADGILTGLASGPVPITVAVDGMNSAATVVQVVTVSMAPSISVDWPDRSRNLTAASSALSVKVVLHSTIGASADIEIDGNRGQAIAAHTETYAVTSPATVGPYTLLATFYSKASRAGIVTATAGADVAIAAAGTITKPDGTALGAIGFTGKVAQVAVNAGQSVAVGGAAQLAATATDTNSKVLALSAGSYSWASTSGATFANVEVDGITHGLAVGSVTVTATVDGVTSTGVPVLVTIPPDFTNPGFETPPIATSSSMANGPTGFQWSGTFTSGVNTWGIANGAGAWGSAAHTGAQYAFIQHGASMSQTVSGLTVGQTYHIAFWCARRSGNGGGNSAAPMTVTVTGTTLLGPFSPTNDGNWNLFTTNSFAATNTSYTFVFQTADGTTDASDLIDDVHLVQG